MQSPSLSQTKEDPSEQGSSFVFFIRGHYGMVKKGKGNFSRRSIRESRRVGIFHRPRTDEVQRKFCLHYEWTLHLHVRQIMHDSFDLPSSPTINSSRWTSNQEMQKLAKEESSGCWFMPWSCVEGVQNILIFCTPSLGAKWLLFACIEILYKNELVYR